MGCPLLDRVNPKMRRLYTHAAAACYTYQHHGIHHMYIRARLLMLVASLMSCCT